MFYNPDPNHKILESIFHTMILKGHQDETVTAAGDSDIGLGSTGKPKKITRKKH